MILALMVGPAFLLIITHSIEKGFRAGALFALGVMLSDAIILSSTYWGLSYIYEDPTFQMVFSLIGGMLILGIGFVMLTQKTKALDSLEPAPNGNGHGWKLVLKGFMINVLSPVAFMFWVTFISTAQIDFGFNSTQNLVFFSAILLTLLLCDFLKAYLADHIRKFLNDRRLLILNRVFGVVLVGLGLRLLFLYVLM
ncbi:MAG: LysE family transporter [Bacteroidota bacterium]